MYQEISNWIDNLDLVVIPEKVAAFCFNLYDGCDNEHWSIELIGADSFDAEDSDWACCEVCDFGSRDPKYKWTRTGKWDEVLAEIEAVLRQYLATGKYAHVLRSKSAVAVGFTDGDLEILFIK